MDNLIQFKTTPVKTVYAVVYSTGNQPWNGTAFETENPADQPSYAVPLPETAPGSGFYSGAFPAAIPNGTYGVVVFIQVGAQPAASDPDLGEATVGWLGGYITAPWTPATGGFSDGLNSTVQVLIDTGASGAPTTSDEDSEAGPLENYQPVAGLSAVPCRIVQQDWPPPTHMWTKTDQAATGWHKVLFAGVIQLDERHCLKFVDPALNVTRYLYVMGQAKNAHQMNVFSRADCLEFAL